MFTCNQCIRKRCNKTGKPCSRINKLFRRLGIYGSNYIRPHSNNVWLELPFTSMSSNWRSKIGLYSKEELDTTV